MSINIYDLRENGGKTTIFGLSPGPAFNLCQYFKPTLRNLNGERQLS